MNRTAVSKILFLAANPTNSTRLRLDKEIREIDEGLQRSTHRDRFELKQKWAVRPSDLQRYIGDINPQIVHFSGHGLGSEVSEKSSWDTRDIGPVPEDELQGEAQPEGLVFEDDLGRVRLVGTDALAGLFEQFTNQVECVVLNACFSKKQALAIAQHIPYVIGMNRAIGDDAARVFSVGFYDALGAGRDFEPAYKLACNRIALEGISEHLTPVLNKQSELKAMQLQALKVISDADPNASEINIPIVASNGQLYIVRPHLEKRCYEAILRPGTLIRIKSPDKMGKSLMMSRVIDFAKQQGYRTAVVDLCEANQDIFTDINNFLQWLCFYISDQLNIDQNPEVNWKKFLGANPNCTKYFEKHLLGDKEMKLVIAFDNFDRIFEYANIEVDFCGLLRGWFEKVNTNKIWGNLRQIIVYSQESYASHDINQSPFNVGLPIELDEIELSHVLALANAYHLTWTMTEAESLMNMVGGHPYLIRLALDAIAYQKIGLNELLVTAPTDEGIYGDYLNERLQSLEKNALLVEAMNRLVNADCAVRFGSKEAFKLDSMGLIKRQGNDIVPRCDLYRLYFRDRLR